MPSRAKTFFFCNRWCSLWEYRQRSCSFTSLFSNSALLSLFSLSTSSHAPSVKYRVNAGASHKRPVRNDTARIVYIKVMLCEWQNAITLTDTWMPAMFHVWKVLFQLFFGMNRRTGCIAAMHRNVKNRIVEVLPTRLQWQVICGKWDRK